MKNLLFLALVLVGAALALRDTVPSPPLESECPKPTPQTPKCRYYTEKKVFGEIASQFNAFIRHDFTCAGSDVEGRLAVGGNLNLQGGFDVGCKTYSTDGHNCEDVTCTAIALVGDFPYALVVGGNAVYPSGQIHSGGAIIHGSLTGHPTLHSSCGAAVTGDAINFDAEFADLIETSSLLNALTSTGTVQLDSGNNVFFKGTGASLDVFRISAATLALAKRISFSGINPLATVIVNIDGKTITAGSFGFDSQGLERNVLWNFHEATKITLKSLGWRGTIFAPLADIFTENGGVIIGAVIANSYTGVGYGCFQINWFEFRGCVPDNHPHQPPTVCTKPFGPIASDYNIFVFEDYVCQNSDVEGRVAAGGNIHVKNWAAGCQVLPPSDGNCLRIGEKHCADLAAAGVNPSTLVAGISIDMENTEIKVGDVVYGYQLNNVNSNYDSTDCHLTKSTTILDFSQAQAYLVCLSETLAKLSATGIYTNQYNQLVFKGTGTADVEIFNLAGLFLSSAVSVEFKNIKAGATVIVNVNGANLGVGNFGFLGSLQQEYLLWNFYEATTLRFYSVGWRGAILAPKAAITESSGVLYGQVFARSWVQPTQCMQNNYVQFKGCLPECTKNPIPPTVGCADGKREGFADQSKYPCIAACAAAWDVKGVLNPQPTCNRLAGDDFPTQTAGCSVADACAAGWHVCATQEEVSNAFSHAGSCYDAGAGFYVSQVSGPGCGFCSVSSGSNSACTGTTCSPSCKPNALTHNDLFGCGTLTDASGEPAFAVPQANCSPFNIFSGNLCGAVPGLDCGADGVKEAENVVKRSTAGGGVLCCIDQCNDKYDDTTVIRK